MALDTLPDDEELMRFLAFAEQELPGVEALVARAARDGPDVRGSQALEERVFGEQGVESFHRFLRQAAGAGRASWRTRASSVRSIPTGHHVMQRPQPTQPVSPNWSTHVASLCVIHCR